MFNTVGPRTCARVSLENFSTPRGIVPGPESPGTAGRSCRPSDRSVSTPGQLFDPGGPWTRARGARGSCSTLQVLELIPESPETAGRHAVTQTRAGVARDIWSTLQALELSLSWPGQLVDTVGPRKRAQFAWDSWLTPRTPQDGPNSPRTAARRHSTSDTGPFARDI